ncbi:unnamed protein product [Parajaminaea phylloscopi]
MMTIPQRPGAPAPAIARRAPSCSPAAQAGTDVVVCPLGEAQVPPGVLSRWFSSGQAEGTAVLGTDTQRHFSTSSSYTLDWACHDNCLTPLMSAYDLHQRLRTKGIRLLRKKAYDDAIKTIGDGAVQMLEQKEQGSGCDLGVYLTDIYEQADQPCDDSARARLTQIISLAANDFWRKKVIDAAVKWSVQATGNPAGDSLLRLSIAEVLAKEGSYFEAETHFLAACIPSPTDPSVSAAKEAPSSFARMMVEWLGHFAEAAAAQAGGQREATTLERVESGKWALRALMPLLALRAPQAARDFLELFIAQITSKHSSLLLPMNPNPRPYTSPAGVESSAAPPPKLQLSVTANPDLNFAQMALALCLHAAAVKPLSSSASSGARVPEGLKGAWVNLVRQYEREGGDSINEQGIGEAISVISTDYFRLQTQRPQGNFMQDMLSSLMGGGAQKDQGKSADQENKKEKVQPLIIKQVPRPELRPPQAAGEEEGDAAQASQVEAPEEEDLD